MPRQSKVESALQSKADEKKDRKIEKLEAEKKQLENELRKSKKVNDSIQQQLEQLQQSKFKLQKAGANTRIKKGSFFRIVCPDTHGCHVDKSAWQAFMQDVEAVRPKEFVWLGDHLSCDGFLAQHHVLGYVAQSEYTFADDVSAANQQLDQVADAGNPKQWYIEGNHEVRIEKWIMKQVASNPKDAEYLRAMFSPESVMNLDSRGIPYIHTLDTSFNNGNSRGVLELGKCLFLHGFSHAKHAAYATVTDLGANCVIGHIHRRQSATKTTHTGEISCWCPGCLCELRQYYIHSKPSHHSHGYALQVVHKDGSFFHMNVPIIEGKSYVHDLIRMLK